MAVCRNQQNTIFLMIRYSLERTVFITANRHSKGANMLSYAKEIYHACAHGAHRFANRVRKLFSHTIDIRLVLAGVRTCVSARWM